MEIKKVGVLGCGTMGTGIAIVCATSGYQTIVEEVSSEKLSEGMEKMEKFLEAGVKKGKSTKEKMEETLKRLHKTTDLKELKDCQIIIEAIYEDLELKKKTFAELNKICPEETIFVTNTSVLSITAIASGSGRPDRVIGMHFCNPAPLMKLIELTKAVQTSEETYEIAKKFGESIGKVLANTKDSPGFIVNLFLIPFNNDCLRALEAGLASAEDIDKAIKLGLGYPMGPFELLDIVGLEVHYAVSMALYEQLRDHRFFPPAIVRRRIDAGLLGKKTGKGFYEYQTKGVFGT